MFKNVFLSVLFCASFKCSAQLDWFMVMSKEKNKTITNQVVYSNLTRNGWPGDFIDDWSAKGFIINHISIRKLYLIIVMTKFNNYSPRQDVIVSKSPWKWLKDRRKDGYTPFRMVKGYFPGGIQWVVVMNKENYGYRYFEGYAPTHELKSNLTYKIEQVQHTWDDARRNFVYVMTTKPKTGYKWGRRSYFPEEYLSDQANLGYYIRFISYTWEQRIYKGWDFVLEKNNNTEDQIYFHKGPHPSVNSLNWFKEKVKEGYFITFVF